jgi:hypothetical protein
MRPPSAQTSGQDDGSGKTTSEICPVCNTPRMNHDGDFCEVCRYNFANREAFDAGAPSQVAPAVAPPIAAVAAPPPLDPLAAFPPSRRWDVLIDIDPSRDPGATDLPDLPQRIFSLDLPENLIGRRNDKLNIHPEIPVEPDEAVSKRHARIFFDASGQPLLIDLNSSNGTKVNDVDITPGVPIPLKDGDRIILGRWTKITVKAR